jgi:hypothetical protein
MTNTAVQRVVYFQLWRWMVFFCGFVPIWWTSFYFMRVVTIIVESRLFPFKQVLYYIIGVRVRPPELCCAAFLLLPGTNLERQQLCKYTNTHYLALSSCFCQAPTWSDNSSVNIPTCTILRCYLASARHQLGVGTAL